MCFLGGGTHITTDMCFLGGGTHITRDMCFPGEGTHITRDTLHLMSKTLIFILFYFIFLHNRWKSLAAEYLATPDPFK